MTNLGSLDAAINAYRKRFDIEEMFRDLKSGDYNLEETWVTGDRLIGLLVLMTLAYSMTTIEGKTLKIWVFKSILDELKKKGDDLRSGDDHRNGGIAAFILAFTVILGSISMAIFRTVSSH